MYYGACTNLDVTDNLVGADMLDYEANSKTSSDGVACDGDSIEK